MCFKDVPTTFIYGESGIFDDMISSWSSSKILIFSYKIVDFSVIVSNSVKTKFEVMRILL